ncbi:MAG: hypothetical protein AAGA54_25790 [Myxococcota bacterium]
MRTAQRLLVAMLGLGLLGPAAGCRPDAERSVRTPKGGVRLGYALKTGTSFDGHLRIGTTRQVEGLSESLTQSVECDARLFVMAVDESGAATVRATFRNVDLDWSVPPAVGLSSDQFAKLASEQLRGLELRFTLSSRGKLLALPTGPQRPAPEIVGLLDTLGLAVTLGFVEMPAAAIEPRHAWQDIPADPVRLLGAPTIAATFEGRVRPGKDGPVLARVAQTLTSAREVSTPSGPRRRQIEADVMLRLDADGVPAQVDSELRDFDPQRGLAVQEFHSAWTLTDAGNDAATAVQDITDPCDPDYVGSERCTAPETP